MGFCEISYGFDICEKKHLERAFRLGDSRTCKNEDRTLKNLVMAYNESRDYSAFTQIFSPMVDSYIENNTIIRTVEHPDIESNVFREHDPNNQAIDSPTKYRNNLVVLVSEKTRKGEEIKFILVGLWQNSIIQIIFFLIWIAPSLYSAII